MPPTAVRALSTQKGVDEAEEWPVAAGRAADDAPMERALAVCKLRAVVAQRQLRLARPAAAAMAAW